MATKSGGSPANAPPHSAEDATLPELRRSAIRLLAMLVALLVAVVPVIGDLPIAPTARTGMLSWLLVALAFYWLYAGMGYRPLLLLQLALFSSAATLLSARFIGTAIDIGRLTLFRSVARGLILLGAACAGANLIGMLAKLARSRR